MTTVTLVKATDLITVDELRICASFLRDYVPRVTKPWMLPDCKVQYSDRMQPGSWNVYLSDAGLNPGAYGYHRNENGTPTGYVSPSMCGVNGLTGGARESALWGVYVPAKIPFIMPGMLSVIAHEVAEMLVDPNLDTWRTSPIGEEWLVEVGDQANATHFVTTVDTILLRPVTKIVRKGKLWTKATSLQKMKISKTGVLADFTLPSFYDVNGVQPYSYTGLVTGPYGHGHLTYATVKDATGARMEQFAKPGDLD